MCVISIASLHQFRNCPVPRLRSSVCTCSVRRGAAGRTGSAASAHMRSNLCSEHRRAALSDAFDWFLNGWLKKATIDPYNSKIRAQVIQSRTSWHSMIEAKKEKRTRRFADQAFARCHPEAEDPQPERLYKEEERE